MTHTKRSPEFQAKIQRLMKSIENMNGPEINEIYDVLKNNTTDSGCLVRAKDDEPIFVLRGKDPLAGDVVDYWAKCARLGGHHEQDKIDDAHLCADKMREFEGRKVQG